MLPELAITRLPAGGPAAQTALPRRDRRRRRGARGRRRGDRRPARRASTVTRPFTTGSTCSPTAASSAATAKVLLPNYGVFDERRYFEPGRGRRADRARRRADRAHGLRGHLVPGAAGLGGGAGRRGADRQRLRLALPPGQGQRARADGRRAGPRERRPDRPLQRGRRPGRARLRRPQLRRRRRRRDARPRGPVRATSCWSAISSCRSGCRPARIPPGRRRSRASAADGDREAPTEPALAPAAATTSRRSTRRCGSGSRTTSARTASRTSCSGSPGASTRPWSRCSPPMRSERTGSAASSCPPPTPASRPRGCPRDRRKPGLRGDLDRDRAGDDGLRGGARRALRRDRGRRCRGEPAGPDPRQHRHGALEQVRLAPADRPATSPRCRSATRRSTATWPEASR